MGTTLLPSREPKKGRKCYVTLAFCGSLAKGTKSKVAELGARTKLWMCSPKEYHQKDFRRNGVSASKNTLKTPPQTILKKKGGVSKTPHRITFLRPPPPLLKIFPTFPLVKNQLTALTDGKMGFFSTHRHSPQRRLVRILEMEIMEKKTSNAEQCRTPPPHNDCSRCIATTDSAPTQTQISRLHGVAWRPSYGHHAGLNG